MLTVARWNETSGSRIGCAGADLYGGRSEDVFSQKMTASWVAISQTFEYPAGNTHTL